MADDFKNLDEAWEENPEELEENLDEDDGLIELVDEEGETQVFELMGSFELDGQQYLAVADPTEEEDPESMEVFILKIVEDEDGNDTYVTVEDEEADKAFNHFLTLVDAEEEN